MSKQKRIGKIFIDYLRNGRGATAVIPFSTRATANAPVSAPISWKELETLTNATQFNLRNMIERLYNLKVDPWEDFFKLRQYLPKI